MAEYKHGEMDISQNEKTFASFLKWTNWSVAIILLVIVAMAVYIT